MAQIVIDGQTPESYMELIELLQNGQISTGALTPEDIADSDALQTALRRGDIKPVYLQNGRLIGFTKTAGYDPSVSNIVTTQVMTGLTASDPAQAVYDISSNKTLGMVGKGIVLASVLPWLSVKYSADESSEDVALALDSIITSWTIDGNNVPVLIDETGKTYFNSEMIVAIRKKLIELSVYASGGYNPDDTQYTETTVTPLSMSIHEAIIVDLRARLKHAETTQTQMYQNIDNNEVVNFFNYVIGILSARSYPDTAVPIALFDSIMCTGVNLGSSTLTYTSKTPFSINTLGQDVSVPYERLTCPYNWLYSLVYSSASSEAIGFTTVLKASSGLGYRNQPYMLISYKNSYNAALEMRIALESAVVSGVQRVREYDITQATGGNTVFYTPYNIINNSGYVGNPMMLLASGSQTVPGYESDNPDFGDETIPLDDIYPELPDDSINIPAPFDLETPVDNDYPWYPVHVNPEPYPDNNITDPDVTISTDPDVTDPDVMQILIDLVIKLIDDNTDGKPTITTGDIGDTPNAEPPLISSAGNNLWTVYNPSLQIVKDFGAWLWSSNIIDQIMRVFNSPIDAVIGFHMIYCTPETGDNQNIKAGYLDSGVSSPVVTDQYVTIDCGTIHIQEFYGNVLDYDNTEISLYLPFIGIVSLDANTCMDADIQIIYRVDILTGTCLAQVKVIKEMSNAVMYAFDGNCSVQIPLTATTYTGMVGALLSAGGAAASFMAGDMFHGVKGALSAAGSAIGGLSGVKKSGSMSSNAGALGIRKPYLIINHPVMSMPFRYPEIEGLPANESVILGDCSGFARVRSCHVENIVSATADEQNMIRDLLQEGILI